MEITVDPTCWITERGVRMGVPFVRYATTEGDAWEIRGVCAACGECEVGAVNPNLVWTGIPVGEAGACLDSTYATRLDVPVRPELTVNMAHCSLTGDYL